MPILEPGRKRRRSSPAPRLTVALWVVAGWLVVLIVVGAVIR